ncbi:MAG: hypothetical protein LQ342_001255 [Letrouitia transgressa]|nr:MAG: hypothetical protein LQ342_001255 [Letrouitia transgressa]
MAARSLISRHWQKILSKWPLDPNRSEVQFQKVMRRRIDRQYGQPDIKVKPSPPTKESSGKLEPPLKTYSEKDELEQVNALYSFLENRYSKKYPLSDKIMKPQSDPIHFERLLKELDEAPNRPWWQMQWLRLKSKVRLK